MADVLFAHRVEETTTTTGTGTYTVDGATTGNQAINDGIGDGNASHFMASDGTDWEHFLGTYTHAGTTLSRDQVFESSNSDAAVNWGAGTKFIWCFDPTALAFGGQKAKTGAYTAVDEDRTILCDASGGAFTVTLMAAANREGKRLTILKTDSSSNAVTVDGNSSETINGDTTASLATQYAALTIESDGTNWLKVGDPAGGTGDELLSYLGMFL